MTPAVNAEHAAVRDATVTLHWPMPRGQSLEFLTPLLAQQSHELFMPQQIHGARVIRVDRWTKEHLIADADGLVTDDARVALAAKGADCQILVVGGPGVAGVVHAGWKGIIGGAGPALVACLLDTVLPSERLRLLEGLQVWVSPSVGPCHYVFDPTDHEGMGRVRIFQSMFRPNVATEDPDTGQWHLDLRAAQLIALERSGLRSTQIHFDPRCTVCASEQFPSHRRDGEMRTTNLIGSIMLTP